MKIGIDCRMYGLKHAGIGRYVENLVTEILKKDKKNSYVLFVRKEDFKNLSKKFLNVRVVEADIPHYSIREQTDFPLIMGKQKVDLMHFPHFNVPVLYNGKFVITIHDLVKHNSKGKETTTRNLGIYWLKYFGYKTIFEHSVRRAIKILVPSYFVKKDLLNNYKQPRGKIVVTYEGVNILGSGKKSKEEVSKILKKYKTESPFVLYVGSVYPHKNIERLIKAVLLLNNEGIFINLVVVCARSVFWQRLENKIKELKAEKIVNLAGFVPDEELIFLYKEAKALVFPSLSEGFGLPGLEAISNETPLIASDIPVFREIYEEAAIYFDPYSEKDIKEKIKIVLENKELRERLKETGKIVSEKFDWKKTASETINVYNEAFK
ncbi:glycosyltransferase family 4 protein [Patescibacteria group bacterium]|nr:glycosyltransferase family 4 protein [Patescibacteria group bacterium]